MDKIQKFIKRLSKTQSQLLAKVLLDIIALKLTSYDVKKMKGFKDYYRLRVGKIGIVFRKLKKESLVIDIDFRGGIYKNICVNYYSIDLITYI